MGIIVAADPEHIVEWSEKDDGTKPVNYYHYFMVTSEIRNVGISRNEGDTKTTFIPSFGHHQISSIPTGASKSWMTIGKSWKKKEK